MQLIPCTGNWHCWASPCNTFTWADTTSSIFLCCRWCICYEKLHYEALSFKDQPAPNQIFNYRLSRARRIVENVFGIIANRFRVLRKPLIQSPTSIVNIVLAVCVLHNFLMSTQGSRSSYLQPGLLDTECTDTHKVRCGMWREEGIPSTNLLQLQRWPCPRPQNSIRNELREGEISWQYKHIWKHS